MARAGSVPAPCRVAWSAAWVSRDAAVCGSTTDRNARSTASRRKPSDCSVRIGWGVGQGPEVGGRRGHQIGLEPRPTRDPVPRGDPDPARNGGQVYLEIDGQPEVTEQLGMVAEQAERGVEVEARRCRVVLVRPGHRRAVRVRLDQATGFGFRARAVEEAGRCGQRPQLRPARWAVGMLTRSAQVEVEDGGGEIPARHRPQRRVAEVDDAVRGDRRARAEHRGPHGRGGDGAQHAVANSRPVDEHAQRERAGERRRPVEPFRVVAQPPAVLEPRGEVDGQPADPAGATGRQGEREQVTYRHGRVLDGVQEKAAQ